jgi:uncharacterized RDD family membrane protein YckC
MVATEGSGAIRRGVWELGTGETEELEYVGFWPRLWATLIDAVLILVVLMPLLSALYGPAYFVSNPFSGHSADVFMSFALPSLVVIAFWTGRSATPGKMAISARIMDERTGGPPSMGQLVGRYFGYLLSVIPFGLGLLWVAFDKKKQGWHDKLSGTIVVRVRRTHGTQGRGAEPEP